MRREQLAGGGSLPTRSGRPRPASFRLTGSARVHRTSRAYRCRFRNAAGCSPDFTRRHRLMVLVVTSRRPSSELPVSASRCGRLLPMLTPSWRRYWFQARYDHLEGSEPCRRPALWPSTSPSVSVPIGATRLALAATPGNSSCGCGDLEDSKRAVDRSNNLLFSEERKPKAVSAHSLMYLALTPPPSPGRLRLLRRHAS